MNVCIPTLNAIDDFWKCVDSLQKSSVPCHINVIDNGFLVGKQTGISNMTVFTPASNLGVAGSWNWFIDRVPGDKIITNDDIIFDRYAIEKMYENVFDNYLTVPENLNSFFSCFLLPQQVVDRVGKFDEWISPRYAYFEDNDYSYRMSLLGVNVIRASGAFVEHVGSSTLKHFDKNKEREHHEKFRFARSHYIKKWGGEPGQETFLTPFGK